MSAWWTRPLTSRERVEDPPPGAAGPVRGTGRARGGLLRRGGGLGAAHAVETVGEAHRRLLKRPLRAVRSAWSASPPATCGRMWASTRSLMATATGRLRLVEDDRDAPVHRRGDAQRVGDVDRDRGLDGGLDVLGPQTDLGVGPVEHDDAGVLRAADHVEGVDRHAEVLDRRDVEGGDEHEGVGEVDRRQHVLGEAGRGVDDDVVVAAPGHLDDLADRRDGDAVGVPRVVRGAEHVQATRLVRRDEAVEGLVVDAAGHRHRVEDRPLRHQLEADRDVAEGEVEVDEQGLGPAAGQVHRGVRRERGLADAALGGEDRDDLAVAGGTAAGVADEPGGQLAAAPQGVGQRRCGRRRRRPRGPRSAGPGRGS